MRRLFVLALLLFALPAHAVTMDWVTVGDPGNAADTEVMENDGTTGYGAVASTYLISKYPITNAQYAEFLMAVAASDTYGLYNTNMGSGHGGITRSGSSGSYSYSPIAGREGMPVNYVSFYDALRFANWLHNGQPTGAQDGTTTEGGSYTMLDEDYDSGLVIARNPGATIFLTSEDEWYKAAYYDSSSMSYFNYPAGADADTSCAVPGPTTNTANCGDAVGDLTPVGGYTGSASPNGTFDQGGNVVEWNEVIIQPSGGWWRGLRGGSYDGDPGDPDGLAAWDRFGYRPTYESSRIGFRVAAIFTDCSDSIDNDGDGRIDYPDDRGCRDASDSSEREWTLICDDGVDNDGDGRIDYPDDPGCYNSLWVSENPQCMDGTDNDGDGLVDHPDDPACASAFWFTEASQCQDGVNNDPGEDDLIDFDGGESIHGACSAGTCPPGVSDPDGDGVADPDPECVGRPAGLRESTCGLGAELALLLPLVWFWRRRGRI